MSCEIIGVKVGSKLFEGRDGVNRQFVATLCQQVASLMQSGYNPFVVSSGAVVCDQDETRSKNLRASIGWRRLSGLYGDYLEGMGIEAAPILVTDIDLKSRVLDRTLKEAWISKKPVLPIFNANDPVDDEETNQLEICADNDRLFKRLCLKIGTVKLAVIAFDQPGILHSSGHVVRTVRPSDMSMIMTCARDGDKEKGRERMQTKINALARLARAGIYCKLVPGREHNFLLRAVNDETDFGTTFLDAD